MSVARFWVSCSIGPVLLASGLLVQAQSVPQRSEPADPTQNLAENGRPKDDGKTNLFDFVAEKFSSFKKKEGGTEKIEKPNRSAVISARPTKNYGKDYAEAKELFRSGEYGKAEKAFGNLAKKAGKGGSLEGMNKIASSISEVLAEGFSRGHDDVPDIEFESSENGSIYGQTKEGLESLEEDSLFMKGESQFAGGRLPEAQDTFTLLLINYPTTRHLPQAIQKLYDIAYIWLEDARLKSRNEQAEHSTFSRIVNFTDKSRPMTNTDGRALKTIDTIQQYDPFGPLTDDALMMAGALMFIKRKYIVAAGYYEQLFTDRPKSEHATRAMILGAKSYMFSYQGPNYDAHDLDNAYRLIKAALARGNDLSAEQRSRLEKDQNNIYVERAIRDFKTAQQYLKLRKPGSAHYYFAQVIQKYPDTGWARRAEQEISKLESLPQSEENSAPATDLAVQIPTTIAPPKVDQPKPQSKQKERISRFFTRMTRRFWPRGDQQTLARQIYRTTGRDESRPTAETTDPMPMQDPRTSQAESSKGPAPEPEPAPSNLLKSIRPYLRR